MCDPIEIGPGDSAYILAWCAWREAQIQVSEEFDEDVCRKAFAQWWEDAGKFQLEQYGYHVLDTPGPTPAIYLWSAIKVMRVLIPPIVFDIPSPQPGESHFR